MYNVYIPLLDDDFELIEIDNAINAIGTSKGLDGLHPDITKLFSVKMKLYLIRLMNFVFDNRYPDIYLSIPLLY